MMKSGILILIIITWFSLSNAIAQSKQHTYRFFDELTVAAPECGPDLDKVSNLSSCSTNTPGGIFTTDFLHGAIRKVYHNEPNWGLSYSNETSLIKSTYTIQMYFKITDWGVERAKIFGFSNGGADDGLFLTKDPTSNERCLEFDNQGIIGDCPFFNKNNYYLITITRDGTTNELLIYVNKKLYLKYNDSALNYIGKPNRPLYFFKYNQAITCHTIEVNLAYLSLSNEFATTDQVIQNFDSIEYNINRNSAAEFSIDPNPSCGNESNITITYTGSISPSETDYTFDWNWDNGTVVSGSGRGPYVLRWNTPGSKDVTLTVSRTDPGCKNPLPNTKTAVISNLDMEATFTPPTCTDVNAIINATPKDGRAPFQYSINAINYQSSGTFRVPANTYKVYVKDADGCVVSRDVTIPAIETVTVNTLDDLTICEGESIRLTTTSNGTTFSGLPTHDLSDITSKDPEASPTSTTEYTVTADKDGCKVVDKVLVTVEPKFALTITPDTQIDSEVPFQLEVSSPQLDALGGSYLWMPPLGLDDPRSARPTAFLQSSQTYTVRATSPEGCASEASVRITVTPPDWLEIPSAFTPNGDGVNDALTVIAKGITNLNYFKIYNRWGQLVFYTNSITAGWDGRYNGGSPIEGTYNFQVEGVTTKGKVIRKEGSVILLL